MCIDKRRTEPRHQLTNTATRGITFVASWLQVYPLLSGLEGSQWLGGFRCALCFLAFRVECSQHPVGKGAQKTALLAQTKSLAPCGWAGHWLVWVAAFRGQAGPGWVQAGRFFGRFFWRSEVLPARLLFATNPRMILETLRNTSLFLTHPQQRPRTPRNELLEGYFSKNPSRVWPGTRNSTYFKIGLF